MFISAGNAKGGVVILYLRHRVSALERLEVI